MEVRLLPTGEGPCAVALVGSAQHVDTSALLDALVSACADGDAVVDVSGVPVITSSLFGVLQAVTRRVQQHGARLVVVCPPSELERLRAMRAGRDFRVTGSLDTARWDLARAPSRFQREP